MCSHSPLDFQLKPGGLATRSLEKVRPQRGVHSSAVHLTLYNLASWVVGAPRWNLAMKPLLIVLSAVVVLIIGTLAVMNNACKSAQHPWCAPHIAKLRTARQLAPCSGQAAASPIEPLVPTPRVCRGPGSPSRSLVFAGRPARRGN